MQTCTGGARIWAILVALAALGPAPRQAAAVVFVYWDQNEEEDFFVDPAGPIGLLIPPWDPNGQMAILPGPSGSFVVGYNPTLPSQNNPGSLMPAKDPPVGLAEYDKLGNFTGRTIFVPGPYALPGSTVGGDIPPDQSSGNEFNNNATYTGVVFDPRGNLFAVDIGTAQGQIPPPDNGRLIEWFPPNYDTYCILFGPTQGGVGDHHVDGIGGLRDPGILAADKQGNIYVPEPGATDPATGQAPGFGRVLKFIASSFPTRAADCPPPTNMPTTPVRFEVFIQGDPQNQPFPSAIARDPQCNCWAVSSVFGAPAVAWYNDDGSPHVGKGPVPAGNFNPFGIAFIPAGDLYLVDIHIQCTGGGPENPGASCGPQEDAGQILRVTFTSGFPSAPVTIAGGLNFPVSVTTCDASARTCPRPAPGNVGGSIGSVDWPTYGHDLHRTFNGKTSLDQTSVRTLAQAWSFPTGDAVTANPIVVNGTVYVGSWDGNFYAIDATTGQQRWKFTVDPQPAVKPVPGNRQPGDVASDGGIITSSAYFLPGRGRRPGLVIFGGGYTLYALRAADGSLFWKHAYTGRPELPPDPGNDGTRIFSSPAVVGNVVLFSADADGQQGFRGYLAAADVNTGNPVWIRELDVDQNGTILNDGCGGVWASPTIIERENVEVVGVADCQFLGSAPYSERVLAVNITDGTIRWVFTPPRLGASDPPCDFDLGATANLGTAADGTPAFLGVAGKDGTYYSLDPATGALSWQRNVVFGGFAGGFIGSTAYDGRRVYGATALGDFGNTCEPGNPADQPLQEPSMHAFDVLTGNLPWQQTGSQSFGPTTVAGGMTFVGQGLASELQIRDAASGLLLNRIPLPAASDSGVVTVGNAIFFGIGSSASGTPAGVMAYTPAGQAPQLAQGGS